MIATDVDNSISLENQPLAARHEAAYAVIAEYRRRIAAHEGIFADPVERARGTRAMDKLEATRRRADCMLN